jgi:hypothetical protein
MASEDSAEEVVDRRSSLLTLHVHGVGKLDELRDSLFRLLDSALERSDSTDKPNVVLCTCREAHTAFEERDDRLTIVFLEWME